MIVFNRQLQVMFTYFYRTDVWGMGCLLYAWWYGYSPFECEMTDSGLKVVECSALRILSPIPTPSMPTNDDKILLSLVEWMLEKDMTKRPFTTDIIRRVDEIMTNIGCYRQNAYSDPLSSSV